MYKSLLTIFFVFFFSYSSANNLEIHGLNKLSLEDIQTLTSKNIFSDNLELNDINIIINDLYESNLIYDLFFFQNEENFVIEIQESKLINKIFITGNKFIKDNQILDLIEVKENILLDKDSIRKTENLIKQIYISKGYNNANIVSITENISVDRVNLIFQINEGGLSYLSKIKFIGNSSLSNSYLTNLINSKDRGLLSFLSNKGYYDQNLINFDKEILISNYREKGFFDVKIQTLVVESVFNSYILEFYINEGKRYKIDEIIYNLDDEIISDKLLEIQNNFKTTIEKNDNYFDGLYLQNHLDNLIKFFQNSNLPFYTFEANIMTDNIENSSNLVIKSEKIKLKLINKINISGNSITKDKVVRSRLNFESGDYLNNFYIDKAKEDLKKLPYINSVEIKYSEIDNMNSDIDINISENKKTGDISLAGFFSSDAGAGITFAINDSNIFGSGNQLKVNMNLSEEYVQFTSSYSKISQKNPYLKNTFNISNVENDLSGSYGFKVKQQGIGYSSSFKYSDKINLSTGINFKTSEGHSPKENISPINDNIGNFQDFIFNFSINSNSTNDIYYPTNGIVNNLSFAISPTGLSDNTYYKLRYDHSIFIDNETNDNFYFISSKLGLSDAFKGNLKTSNTFSLGGSNFQGFDYRGIGQFNSSTYLGGNKFFTFTAGLGGNLLFDKKDNIYFKSFLSTGSIWDSDYANNDDINLRSSLGFSVDFIASSIPVTFTYALPIQKELNDKTRLFSFAIGTSF